MCGFHKHNIFIIIDKLRLHNSENLYSAFTAIKIDPFQTLKFDNLSFNKGIIINNKVYFSVYPNNKGILFGLVTFFENL